MRRVAIALLLGVNLAGGLIRYGGLEPFGPGRLWDLSSLLTLVRECAPESFASALPSPACQSLPPYLPAAFPVFRFLASLPWLLVETAWYAGMGLALIGVFSREAIAWARDPRVTRPGFEVAAFVAVFASLVFFKGTSLGFLAGQSSLVVSLLLYAFAVLEDDESSYPSHAVPAVRDLSVDNRRGAMDARRWLAACCLAAAASKLNLAAPFFVYLLLRRDAALLAAATLLTAGLHLGASFAWLGPAGYLELLRRGPADLAAFPNNVVEGMGATGRIDLEPLLAVTGIRSDLRRFLLGSAGAVALAWLTGIASRLTARELLVTLHAIFFALVYHRDYDLVLFVLLALPLVRGAAHRFGVLAFVASLSFVLPLQFLHDIGIREAPALTGLWNFVGCAMILGVLVVTAWLIPGGRREHRAA